MSHGDVLPGSGRVGEVLTDFVVEANLAFLDQHHDRGGSKLFADRSGLKNGLRLNRNLMLEISQTVTLGQNYLAVLNHRQRDSGNALFLLLGFDVIINADGDCILRTAGAGSQED